MIELCDGTRTLVLLCALSKYDPPSKRQLRQLPTLDRIEPTLQRLLQLLNSSGYAKQGLQAITLWNPSKRELADSLEAVRAALRERPGVNLVVFWSGHGNIHEKSFRLATRDTADPIEYEDGIGLNELVRASGVARVSTWTLFLDACFAGEGLSDVVEVAHALLKSESGRLRGYGALCSSAPFERARDSAFLETVVGVLEQGMSPAARAHAESEGGGGEFNPFNRLLSLGEVFDAVSSEFRAAPEKYRHAVPWSILGGPVSPRLFPNPHFRAREPSRLVENAYRAIARSTDLESHFFPKAQGIDNLESGWHFAGRIDATRLILAWMSRPTESAKNQLCVLAAESGTGKSALLGRLIALTDRNYRAKARAQGWNEAKDLQTGTVPDLDRIDAALSLRNLTPQTLVEHLASLLGLTLANSIEGSVKSAVQSFRRADGAPPCIVLDALDEAIEPTAIVFRVVRPLAQFGWKVLVATRRAAQAKGASNLVADLAPATLIELDKDAQSWRDIHSYVVSRLGQSAALAEVTDAAAHLIADRADGMFLFARMATSSLLRTTRHIAAGELLDLVARDATEALRRDVMALDEEFERHFSCKGSGATALLTALAWGKGDGVPLRDGLWAAMAGAVDSPKAPDLKFEERHVLWMLREAGRFIQESGDGEQAVYRLFHKSLVDHFQQITWRNDPAPEALDERIVLALMAYIRDSNDWTHTNSYLIRHMPAHLAHRAGQKELNSLLRNFDWLQARLNLSGIQALLSDFRLCTSAHPATARLHRTLSMVAHILHQHPDQLIPQLLGRISPGVADGAVQLDGQAGAVHGLPPTTEGLKTSQRHVRQQPNLTINRQHDDLIIRRLSLDALLERAKASIHRPRWVPELGGLQQAGALVYTLQGHEDLVLSVALSADGNIVASGGKDKTVRLWDTRTGQALRVLRGHERPVHCVALSTDGRTVASGDNDGTVRLWDAQTGQSLRTLKRHQGVAVSVAISADGRTVASAGSDKRVHIWDAHTGRVLRSLRGIQGLLDTSVTLSADGSTVASGNYEGTVSLWDAQTGQGLRNLQCHQGSSYRVALSADGRTVAAAGNGRTVSLWDVQTGRVQRTLQVDQHHVRSLALSADGRTVAIGFYDTMYVGDSQTEQALHALKGHQGAFQSLALSADGRIVASVGYDDTVRLWDAQTGQDLRTPQGHQGLVNSLALSSNGRIVASAGSDDTVRLWDAQTGQALRTLQGHIGTASHVALSADGRIVASVCSGKTVRLWDARTGLAIRSLRGQKGRVLSVALSADGRTAASGGNDKRVRLWDTQTGQALRTLQGHQGSVRSVAMSADGRMVASAGSDKRVRLWDAQTGQALFTLRGHERPVCSVALSTDGRTVASGGDDKTVRLWDAQTGKALRTLHGHLGLVRCVALSADGRSVACADSDNRVRLWDVQSGRLLERLTMDAEVSSVSLAEHHGRTMMAVANGQSVVRLMRWDGVPPRA